VDYGKPFKGLLTKAQAIVIQNTNPYPFDLIECCFEGKLFNRTFESFTKNPKCIFNFWTNETEAQVINQLYSVQHITLKDRAKWALGIVTGNNKKFCIDEHKEGYVPVYKGSDITKNGLKEPTTFLLNDFSKFQQVAPLEMYHSKEKLIYKFNLLIPINIGITAEQLTMLLNSEIINWLFKKLFSTHKVLRGDLELLPIHTDYFSYMREFTETDYLNYLQIIKTDDGTYRVKN
jgi:site-specific DNA-methyltransferase (adenine-specific)